MREKYNPKKIEKKWQKNWEKAGIYKTKDFSAKPKFYALDMFPYPSGAGLHVGHPKGFIATDVFSRFKIFQGYNILHPMGWDAFGLPAENYAIKNKIHPSISTKKNVAVYKKQIKKFGFTYDWTREINTTDPEFYKWTQWIFLKMFERGLAYQSDEPVNWCPSCKTVLANEDLEGGLCERCGTQVVQKKMKQWVLKMTAYADRLLYDLDTEELDWEELIKEQQRNWIGRSEGAEVEFPIVIASVPSADGARGNPADDAISSGLLRRSASRNDTKKKILVGTRNEAKVEMIKNAFSLAKNIEVISLNDLPEIDDSKLQEVDDYKENARRKSEFYYSKTGIPTISTDHIVWLEKWPKNKGIITHFREEAGQGKKASDEEVMSFTERFIQENGESKIKFLFSIAYADQNGIQIFESEENHQVLQGKRSSKVRKGYPLDSYVIDSSTGKYLAEQNDCKSYVNFNEAVRAKLIPVIFKQSSSIKVYTTRLDTIFGCTYCVVAPEHPIIEKLKNKIENYSEVEKYIIKAQNKTELERTELQKEKTGVELKGIKAINPFNNEEIPVWVADYVLGFYGTGAVMAVPAHDERDFEFARKYNLPIRIVVKEEEQYKDVNQERLKNFLKEIFEYREKNKFFAVLIGGMAKKIVENDKNYIPSDLDLFVDQKGFDLITNYLKEKGYKEEELSKKDYGWQNAKSLYSDNGNWIDLFIIQKKEDVYFDTETGRRFEWGNEKVFQMVRIDNVNINVPNKELLDRVYYNTTSTGKRCFTGDGILTRSDDYNGLTSKKAREEMANWLEEQGVGKKKVNYKMRDWVFSRQRYWGEPIPVIFCEHCKELVEKFGREKISLNPSLQKRETKKDTLLEKGKTDQGSPFEKGGQGDFSTGELLNPGWIAVEEKDLPLKLPEVKSYEPTGTGESPLANIAKWVNVKCPKCGGPAKRETNTMPQWAGSSWYYLRYVDPKNKKELADKKKEKAWMPVDLYVGGAEHATRHLLYARFWHKFLYDIGVVSTKEPFKKLVHVGLVNAEDGRKMSKRWGNVVNPDDIIAEFGADSMRLYEMFMGPFSQAVAWSTKSVSGVRRFLERIWGLNAKCQMPNAKSMPNDKNQNIKLERLLNKTIKKVTEDIEEFKFNTAISALMILSNEFEKSEKVSKDHFEKFLILLSPFAPHITEELWEKLGHKKSIFTESWPKYDAMLIKDETINLVISVNGKARYKMEAKADITEEEAKKMALASDQIKKYVDGKTIRKVIFVKGRLLNIVV